MSKTEVQVGDRYRINLEEIRLISSLQSFYPWIDEKMSRFEVVIIGLCSDPEYVLISCFGRVFSGRTIDFRIELGFYRV